MDNSHKLTVSGSQPALFDADMGITFFENRKKSNTKHTLKEARNTMKVTSAINLLNVNKSSDFGSKKFLTPKREQVSKVKSFSKNNKESSKAVKKEKIINDSDSDEEMLLDNLVVNELRIGSEAEGKSENGKSFLS